MARVIPCNRQGVFTSDMRVRSRFLRCDAAKLYSFEPFSICIHTFVFVLHTYLERWFRAFTLPGHVVRSLPLHGDAWSSGGNLRLCSLRGVHVLNTWSSVAGVPSGTPRLSYCSFCHVISSPYPRRTIHLNKLEILECLGFASALSIFQVKVRIAVGASMPAPFAVLDVRCWFTSIGYDR